MALTIASSSSMAITWHKSYDVFLSFRGEDTRYGITSHIYKGLSDKKVETYIDEKSLERGNEISPALLTAIEKSKIAVIILSKDYASSSWCLSELVHIHKCRRERGQIVLPIFYKVDPSHVRRQDQGSYRDAFTKHEKSSHHKAETIRDWKAALKESADLSGLHYSGSNNRSESALVKEVVETVMKELGRAVIRDDDFKGLIGMENHFNKLELLLSRNNDSPKLQITCIWGMPGVGKTTIADAVYSRLFCRFESYYFLRNVREGSEKHGLERLRDELIAKLLGDEKLNFGILSNPIPAHSKDRLRRTKVLLVLDDVSKKKQLEHLVGDHFGSGSRIIVTTRDEGVVRGTSIEADVEKYEVGLLSCDESLELFNFTVFRDNAPPPEYKDLSSKVVKHMSRNPLAITVFGSHLRSLRNPSVENWEMELEKLKELSHEDILKVLRISYDGLGKTEKKVFLDIACFFKGMRRGGVENVLNGCNLFASTGIDELIDKSLVTIGDQNDELRMHDLVQQMGKLIVGEESEDPSNRSRLWISDDICHIFNNDVGTGKIEGIFLNTYKLDKYVYMKPTAFKSMHNLRLLIIYDNSPEHVFKVYLRALEYLPLSLRYLEWHQYPLKSLPSSYNPQNLVELKLPFSQVKQLWNGTKNLGKLKGLDLSDSIRLRQIPDLTHAKNLETLNLKSCTSLVHIPWQILRDLHKLYDLNLSYCHKLRSFPDRIDARDLKTLSLQGCVNLKHIPDFVCRSLVSLNLGSTAIVNLPSSIGSIITLSKLDLTDCKRLVKLPSSVSDLHLLKTLDLRFCLSLNKFPELPMNIEDLKLTNTAIKDVPSTCIENCSCLRTLWLNSCKKIESLPSSIFELTSLQELDLTLCSNLKNLPIITNHVESNLLYLRLQGSGIRHLTSSIRNLTKVQNLELFSCKNLEFISNLMPHLTRLYVEDCQKIKRISQLPFSLSYLSTTRCPSLEVVSGSTHCPFRNGVWENSREVDFRTYDYSTYRDCLKLKPSTLDSIVSEFQMKVLHMATQYTAPKYEVKCSPTITTCYPGKEIPDWFNFKGESLVNIPLCPQPCEGDILGFALCAIVAGKNCTTSTNIFCRMKFMSEGEPESMSCFNPDSPTVCSPFIGPNGSMEFPFSKSDQVIMWYKPWDISSLYKASSERVSFEFLIKEHPDKPSKGKLIKCGVHMILSKDDLEELSVAWSIRSRLIEVDDQDDEDDEDSSAMEPHLVRDERSDCTWHGVFSALIAVLLCVLFPFLLRFFMHKQID